MSQRQDPLIKDASAEPRRLLSIVCQGRNDNYMGNFSWRIATVLNNHARNIMTLGIENEVEVLVCDWGSEQPFWETLDLTADARRLTRFLIVPPPIATVYDKDAGFAAPHPTNALARRCWGRYILFADSDIFITLESMGKLMHHLRQGYIHSYSLEDSFMWASKYHVPYDFVQSSPRLEEIDEHIAKNWKSYVPEKVSKENFLGCGVALLMPREMWLESTGWDERLIYWGWNDIDWHRRLNSQYRWDDLEANGMRMFHLEHYAKRFTDYTKENPRKANEQVEPTCFAPNPEDWGLRDHALRMVDGYGLEVDRTTGETPSSKISTFDWQIAPQSAAAIAAQNPMYRDTSKRFQFVSGNPVENEAVILKIAQQLQPKVILEVGSWLGDRSRLFAQQPSVAKVFCVDQWQRNRVEYCVPGGLPETLLNNLYEQFLANAAHSNTAQKIFPIRCDSAQAAEYCMLHGLKFDLIYLGGDHSTVAMKRDLIKWRGLLNPNGLLCGSDWSQQREPENVAGAVVAVAEELNWDVFHDENFWFVIPKIVQQSAGSPQSTVAASPQTPSELDQIIPPEVSHDAFYDAIHRIASRERVTTILEIGSSSGGGSTEAFVTGIRQNPNKPTLFCMELSKPRFNALRERYQSEAGVKCYNVSSVPVDKFPAERELTRFYETVRSNLNDYPLERVLGWLKQDIDYVKSSGVSDRGIEIIKRDNGIQNFDVVLIDGSEFTGVAELEQVYGAKFILLDDITTFKNFENRQRLSQDPNYRLIEENTSLRNGYAVFQRRDA